MLRSMLVAMMMVGAVALQTHSKLSLAPRRSSARSQTQMIDQVQQTQRPTLHCDLTTGRRAIVPPRLESLDGPLQWKRGRPRCDPIKNRLFSLFERDDEREPRSIGTPARVLMATQCSEFKICVTTHV